MPELTPTKEQEDVLDHGGPLVAIAKPGSGKTFVLSELIKQVLPSHSAHQGVIAISFTNKASDELKKRSTEGGVDVKGSFFGTIDKFCGGEIIIPFAAHLWGQPDAPVSITKIEELPEDEQSLFSDIQANAVSLEQIEAHLSDLRAYFKKGIVFLETLGALALFPSKLPGANNDFNNPIYPNWEQDVNLHYVGLTRARKLCVLCTSSQRTNRQGQVKQAKPSEFLLRHDLSSLRKVAKK